MKAYIQECNHYFKYIEGLSQEKVALEIFSEVKISPSNEKQFRQKRFFMCIVYFLI